MFTLCYGSKEEDFNGGMLICDTAHHPLKGLDTLYLVLFLRPQFINIFNLYGFLMLKIVTSDRYVRLLSVHVIFLFYNFVY